MSSEGVVSSGGEVAPVFGKRAVGWGERKTLSRWRKGKRDRTLKKKKP